MKTTTLAELMFANGIAIQRNTKENFQYTLKITHIDHKRERQSK